MFKRCFDIAASGLGLLLLSPLLLVLMLLVRKAMGSPAFFLQQRPGLHGKPFAMVKFRTLSNARDGDGKLLSDAKRMTRVGSFLRRWSLDELPELFNVLKGDMSLVGPRPLLMEYLPLYSREQYRRHEVRPGITGWAQINGRNALSWDEKFALDGWYLDNRSHWLDSKILFFSALRILKRDGISHGDDATMPRFTGSGKLSGHRK